MSLASLYELRQTMLLCVAAVALAGMLLMAGIFLAAVWAAFLGLFALGISGLVLLDFVEDCGKRISG